MNTEGVGLMATSVGSSKLQKRAVGMEESMQKPEFRHSGHLSQ